MRLILEALSLDIGEIKNRVDWALRTLVLRDSILISKRLSEETVAHRLAIYLESLFPKEYDVDCEYNKIVDAEGNNTVPKVVPTRIPTETRPNRTERQIKPDILIHKRGKTGRDANLLAIEVKKKENPNNRQEDIEALETLTKQDFPFQYRLGLFLDIDCSDFSVRRSWFENGHREDEAWIRIA